MQLCRLTCGAGGAAGSGGGNLPAVHVRQADVWVRAHVEAVAAETQADLFLPKRTEALAPGAVPPLRPLTSRCRPCGPPSRSPLCRLCQVRHRTRSFRLPSAQQGAHPSGCVADPLAAGRGQRPVWLQQQQRNERAGRKQSHPSKLCYCYFRQTDPLFWHVSTPNCFRYSDKCDAKGKKKFEVSGHGGSFSPPTVPTWQRGLPSGSRRFVHRVRGAP